MMDLTTDDQHSPWAQGLIADWYTSNHSLPEEA
jgi:hypothetical protein